MDKAVSEIRLHQWESIILEANRSGMTKKEWCQTNGVPLRQFFYWQNKIRDLALHQMYQTESTNPTGILPAVSPGGGFVELKPPTAESIEAHTTAYQKLKYQDMFPELILEAEGCRLLIGNQVNEDTLRTVMKVMLHA